MAARRIALALTALLGILAAPSARAQSQDYIYHSDEPAPLPGEPASPRDQYTREVLRIALERTRTAYGDFTLTRSAPMHERYRPLTLEHGDGGINVSVFPVKAGLDEKLIPVRIPIDRGIMGYRILTIRAKDQPRFDKVNAAEALKPFHFGLLGQWEDVAILRSAGLSVETGSSIDGLMHMLDAGRTDASSFNLASSLQFYDRFGPHFPGIAIEKHLLLHYPMPMYVWFRKDEDGRKRAERMRAGLESMVKDGSMKALFHQIFADVLNRLDIDHRQVIALANPELDGHDPIEESALWFRPGEER